MIQSLTIRNYAIIEAVDIDFSDNLTIITGETGAGKSIMMGALGLIMGKRADTKVLYDQNSKCIVEAVINISEYNLEVFFKEQDIDFSNEILIRREITPTGKSRAFVNDTPVKLETLRELMEQLVDLHQQYDTLDIQSTDFQIRVLDALSNNKDLLEKYRGKYKEYESDKRKLERLRNKSISANKENDFLTFQLKELQEADLREGEQEELDQEQRQLNNAEDIKKALVKASVGLTEEERSIVNNMSDLIREVGDIVEFHPKLPKLLEQFEGLKYELIEISSEFQHIADDTEYDGSRLQEINERMDLIFKLQKKHYVSSVSELISIQEDLEENLQSYQDLDEEISSLERNIGLQRKLLMELGTKISQKRRSIVKSIEEEVGKLLSQLSMKNAQLIIDIKDSENLLPNGTDLVRYLFTANKGGRPEEIKGIASGGEMSRLALCIKSIVADAMTLPTLIFDEIDSGVSGEVAFQMGFILQKLAKNHQVISITHSPQIAAKAKRHYYVHKKDFENRTITAVKLLDKEERIIEIAKMLSGDPPTESAKLNAYELLSR